MPSVKDFIAKMFRIKRTIILTPTEQYQVDRAVDYERGRLQGESLRERNEKEEIQELLKQEEGQKVKDSIARLSKKKEELSNESLIGGCDLKKLFGFLEKNKKIKIKVLSFDMKRSFGNFDTLVSDTKGMLNLFIKEIDNNGKEGKRRRLITGSKLSNIFRFPDGLTQMASKGIFIVNLNENSEYVDDPLSTEIPDLIIDKNGKFDFSKRDTEPFIDRYIKVQSELSDAHSRIETLEKTLAEKIRKENLVKHQLNVAKARADTSESELSVNIKKMTELHSSYAEIIERTRSTAQQLDMSKEEVKVYGNILEKVMGKLEEAKSSTRLESARDLIEDTMEIISTFTPANQETMAESKSQTKFEENLQKTQEQGRNIKNI